MECSNFLFFLKYFLDVWKIIVLFEVVNLKTFTGIPETGMIFNYYLFRKR